VLSYPFLRGKKYPHGVLRVRICRIFECDVEATKCDTGDTNHYHPPLQYYTAQQCLYFFPEPQGQGEYLCRRHMPGKVEIMNKTDSI